MRNYRRSIVYAMSALMAWSNSARAQVEVRELGVESVTIIIPHEYPAFNAGTASRPGRSVLELRAVIMRQAPWSHDHPAIILNPVYANAATLADAFAAVERSNESKQPKNIVLRADRPVRAIDANAGAELRDLLLGLQGQPLVEITKIRGEGRQITVRRSTMARE
jgi:hypothetical protein